MPKYLVMKTAEPEQLGDAYASSLEELPGEETLLMETDDGLIKVRDIPEDVEDEQLHELSNRWPRIWRVEPDYTAHAVENISPEAVRMSAQAAARFHRLNEVSGRGDGTKVAVIDTGISEELYNRYQSRVIGRYDVFDDEDWRDHTSGHGSWCCSVMLGHATGCKLLSYKGLSTKTGSGSYSGIIECIEHARRQDVTHLSMSLGGPASDILDSAVNAASADGIDVYVAAGNDQRGSTVHKANGQSPARAQGAVCVAAMDSDERVADFSNIGNVVDIAGIGVMVECPDSDLISISGYWSGTSMATPYVCATALCAGVGKKDLLAGARDTSEPAVREGHGVADAVGAYRKANPEPGQPKSQMSLYAFGEATIAELAREFKEHGGVIITVGREREPFCEVYPLGRFREDQ